MMNSINGQKIVMDNTKWCLALDEKLNIIAWMEPYLTEDQIKPSIGSPDMDPIIINKSDVPEGVDLADCRYISGEVVYSEERVEERLLNDLRAQRAQEFEKYDKYQLLYLQSGMTDQQIQEYNEWRQAWLDVTETKIIPDKPDWFDTI